MSSAASARQQWRKWRTLLIIGLIVLLGGVGIAAAHQQPANQYLNPGAVTADGTHALADVLTGLGHQVITATSVPAAVQAAIPGSTLVITSPQYLSADELSALARVPASVLLVGPDHAALTVLAAPVSVIGATEPVVVTAPACRLRAATLAGTADMGGRNLLVAEPAAAAAQCYYLYVRPTLVQLRARRPRGHCARDWRAADQRRARERRATPRSPSTCCRATGSSGSCPPSVAVAAAATAGPRTFTEPAAAVRLPGRDPAGGRRAAGRGVAGAPTRPARHRAAASCGPGGGDDRGPRPPVPVQARARAGGRGAARRPAQPARASHRTAARSRSGRCRRGLARAVCAPEPAGISDLLYGPPPANDQALVVLARDLDELEREVGTT